MEERDGEGAYVLLTGGFFAVLGVSRFLGVPRSSSVFVGFLGIVSSRAKDRGLAAAE
jgi:hypothetical protein